MQQGTQLRGFTMGGTAKEFPVLLEEAVGKWNINLIRYAIHNEAEAAINGGTSQEAWDRLIALLPEHLDLAKKLGVTVAILAEYPNEEASSKYPKDSAGRLHAYWTDESNLAALVTGWKQIAEICKDRDQPIWYDIFNEPLDWKDMPSFPKNWPRWAQTIVDEIRKIDPKHPIVIATGPGGLCWGMKDFPVLNGGNLIYEVHLYSPHEYTHQGLSDIHATDLKKAYLDMQKPWPGEFSDSDMAGYWDRTMLEFVLKPAIDFQRRNPTIPIFVGEFSVARWAPGGDQYLKDCIAIFEKYGWDWTYHSFHNDPMWSLEHTDEFSAPQDAKIAPGFTLRGQVVKDALELNKR